MKKQIEFGILYFGSCPRKENRIDLFAETERPKGRKADVQRKATLQ